MPDEKSEPQASTGRRVRRPLPRSCAPGVTDKGWEIAEAWVDEWYRNNRVYFVDGKDHPCIRGALVVRTAGDVSFAWVRDDSSIRQESLTLAFVAEHYPRLLEQDAALLDQLDEMDKGREGRTQWLSMWTTKAIMETVRARLGTSFNPFADQLPSAWVRPDWGTVRKAPQQKAEDKLSALMSEWNRHSHTREKTMNARRTRLQREVQRWDCDAYGTLPYYLFHRLRNAVATATVRQVPRLYRLIDREVWRTLSKARLYNMDFVHWLLSPPQDSPARLYRRQALEQYPAFASVLMRLSSEIDRGRNPLEVIAEDYVVKPATIRAFREKTPGIRMRLDQTKDIQRLPDELMSDRQDRLRGVARNVVGALNLLPVDLLPKTPDDWAGVAETWYVLTRGDLTADVRDSELEFWLRRTRNKGAYSGLNHDVMDFLEEAWHGFLLPIAWRCREDRALAAGFPSELERFADDRSRGVGTGTPWRRNGLEPIANFLVGNRNIRQVNEVSVQWHQRVDDISSALETIGAWTPEVKKDASRRPLVPWPTPAPLDDRGFQVTPLASPSALSIEGRAMEHCVGTYVPYCLRGDSVILSLVCQDGSRSTAEVRRRDNSFVLAQHRSIRNANPPLHHSAALRRYMDAHMQGAAAVTLSAALDEQSELAAASNSSFTPLLAFDPRDDNACAAVFEVWRFSLPHRQRYADWREWATDTGFADFVASDLPKPAPAPEIVPPIEATPAKEAPEPSMLTKLFRRMVGQHGALAAAR